MGDLLEHGRIRAFYGKFGTGFSLLMTGLVGADTDGIPCSGDEPKCFLRMGNATFVFRPEVIDGVARSSHDFCGEGLFCPNGVGIPIADFSAECWDARDGDYVLPPHVLRAFAAPHSCEGLALVPIADPPGVPFAQDGVDISCPLTPGEP